MKKYSRQFGGKITEELKEEYRKSDAWQDGKFQNLVETKMDVNFQTLPKLLYKQIFKTEGRVPSVNLPYEPFVKDKFLQHSAPAEMIWFGHSVLAIHMNGKVILIDPMFGPDASPIAPFATKRFTGNTLRIIEDLPQIDLVLFTHDHYDHIDLDSIERIKKRTKQFFVALGVKRHLVSWGIDSKDVVEFDWWSSKTFADISITFTPTRHFSGRGLTDRAKSLWGGWVLKSDRASIYFSGDGGYGAHFKEVGKRLGPFDMGFMECGQYNENWHQIHLFPEESVTAAVEAGVKTAVPVHWGAFALAQHHWKDPIRRFVKEAERRKLSYSAPKIGAQFNHHHQETTKWWEAFE